MEVYKAVEEIRQFNRFYTNIIGLLDQYILDSPFSLSEARVLFEINSLGECTARKIMENIAIDEGYLSRTVDKLVKAKLLKKTRSATDGRAYLLSLSAKGQREFEKINKASHDEVTAMVEGLSDAELRALTSQMKAIKNLLGKGNEYDNTTGH